MNFLNLLYHKNIIFSRALYIHKEIVCQGDVIFYCIFRKNLIKNRFVTLPRGRRRESASPCKASDGKLMHGYAVMICNNGLPLLMIYSPKGLMIYQVCGNPQSSASSLRGTPTATWIKKSRFEKRDFLSPIRALVRLFL